MAERYSVVINGRVVRWVAGQLHAEFQERAQAIGLECAGQIVAGIVYESLNGASIVVHLAASGRLTRKFLWANADYAFRQCGVRKMIAPIAESSVRMIKMAYKMGFRHEATLTGAHPDGDLYL